MANINLTLLYHFSKYLNIIILSLLYLKTTILLKGFLIQSLTSISSLSGILSSKACMKASLTLSFLKTNLCIFSGKETVFFPKKNLVRRGLPPRHFWKYKLKIFFNSSGYSLLKLIDFF